ncbi:MAG TPA: uracil-DNA glycosylase family protein, partial [Candidatus Dormibacteraeota bacterium]|nr:uracil-DNA glycosylase family protein [Candidatus Dormibacteraeota bacterium]
MVACEPDSVLEEIIGALRDALEAFGPYPAGLAGGPDRVAGTAFFPGGDGVIKPRPPDTIPEILVVGHDFGSLQYLAECVRRGEERLSQPTWRGLLSRVNAAGIDPMRCLFTNALMGFRSEGRNVGACPALRDREYLSRCQALLLRQIEIVRPRAIIALGTGVPAMLAAISADLAPWSRAATLAAIDRAGALVEGARFGEHRANVGVLTHPSYARLNAGRRRYRSREGIELRGEAAEVALLRDAA